MDDERLVRIEEKLDMIISSLSIKAEKKKAREIPKSKVEDLIVKMDNKTLEWDKSLRVSKSGSIEDFLKILSWWLGNIPKEIMNDIKKSYVLVDVKECANEFYKWCKFKGKRREKLFQVLMTFVQRNQQTAEYRNKRNPANIKSTITNVTIDTSALEEQQMLLGG